MTGKVAVVDRHVRKDDKKGGIGERVAVGGEPEKMSRKNSKLGSTD